MHTTTQGKPTANTTRRKARPPRRYRLPVASAADVYAARERQTIDALRAHLIAKGATPAQIAQILEEIEAGEIASE